MSRCFALIILLLVPVSHIFAQDDEPVKRSLLTPAKDNEQCLYGYRDTANQWALKAQYTLARPFNQGYAVVLYGSFYGVINTTGQFAIEPRYTEISACYQSQFMCRCNDTVWLLNGNNKTLLGPFIGQLLCNAANEFLIELNHKWGYADSNGIIITPFAQEQLIFFPCSENVSLFHTDSTEGYITKKGIRIYEGNKESIDWSSWKGFLVNINGKHKLYNWNGNLLYPTLLDTAIRPQDDKTFIVIDHGLYKLIDADGHLLTPHGYNLIARFNEFTQNMLLQKGDKYGMLNAHGKVILQPVYNKLVFAGNAQLQRYFIVEKNKLNGVINDSGHIIIEPKFDAIIGIDDQGNTVAQHGNKMVCFNIITNQPVAFSSVTSIISSTDNKKDFVFTIGNNRGTMDEQGNIIAPPVYSDITTWRNNFIVKSGNQYSLLSNTGKQLFRPSFSAYNLPPDYKEAIHQYEGNVKPGEFLYILTNNGHTGVIDTFGRLVIDTIYQHITYLDENARAFWVTTDSLNWRVVPANGLDINQSAYNAPATFSNSGFAIITQNYKMGVINAHGTVIMPCDYMNIVIDPQGYFWYSTETGWGLTDTKGNKLIAPVIQDFVAYNKGIAFVKQNNRWHIANTEGKTDNNFSFLVDMISDEADANKVPGGALETDTFSQVNFIYNSQAPNEETTLFLIKDASNPQHTSAINNALLNMSNLSGSNPPPPLGPAIVTFAHDSSEEESYPESGWMSEYMYEAICINKNTCTLSSTHRESGHGTGSEENIESNYLFSGDSLLPLKLDRLFKTANYQSFLSNLCMQQIKTMEDVEIDCSNPNNLVPENFEITDEGLVFSLLNNRQAQYNGEDNHFPVTISYKDIEPIVDKNGPLREFYK